METVIVQSNSHFGTHLLEHSCHSVQTVGFWPPTLLPHPSTPARPPPPLPQCKDHNATIPPARSNRDITIYRIQQYSFKLIILYLQECKEKKNAEAQRACPDSEEKLALGLAAFGQATAFSSTPPLPPCGYPAFAKKRKKKWEKTLRVWCFLLLGPGSIGRF